MKLFNTSILQWRYNVSNLSQDARLFMKKKSDFVRSENELEKRLQTKSSNKIQMQHTS